MGWEGEEERQAVSDWRLKTSAKEPAQGARMRAWGHTGKRGPAMGVPHRNTAAGQERAAVVPMSKGTGPGTGQVGQLDI